MSLNKFYGVLHLYKTNSDSDFTITNGINIFNTYHMERVICDAMTVIVVQQ